MELLVAGAREAIGGGRFEAYSSEVLGGAAPWAA
jgi:hypothetical protein